MSVVINGSAGVTTNSGAVYNGIQAGTAVASTSGTSIDFTSIPSWVKRITVMFNGVSTNAASNLRIQLGAAGSTETTGYSSYAIAVIASSASSAAISSTSGFDFVESATSINNGSFVFTLVSSNSWVVVGNIANAPATVITTLGGNKTLSGTLDRVRITTVNGTDTFDAGSINILYE